MPAVAVQSEARVTEADRAFLLAVRRDLVRALAEIEKRLGLAARHCTDCPLRR